MAGWISNYIHIFVRWNFTSLPSVHKNNPIENILIWFLYVLFKLAGYWVNALLKVICIFHPEAVALCYNRFHIFDLINLFYSIQAIWNWHNETDTPYIDQQVGLIGY